MSPIDSAELVTVTGGCLADLGSTLGNVANQWLGNALGGRFGQQSAGYQSAAVGEQLGAADGRAMGGIAGSMFEQQGQPQA